MIFEAVKFATEAHTGQYRKGNKVPYIVHPLGVAKILTKLGYPEEVVVAGVLHDTVEDTPVTYEDIEENFGKKVAELVRGASEPNRSDSWEKRKQHTIDYLKTAPIDIVVVTCADKLDNMLEFQENFAVDGDAIWSRFNSPKEKQQWYYETLAEVFVSRIEDERTERLFRRYDELIKVVFG